MRWSRKRFVLTLLAAGFAFGLATRLVLDHPPTAILATPNQAPWQATVSTVVSPIKAVLIGPVALLMQDPDPPPPLRGLVCAVYWSLLALGMHYLWTKPNHRGTRAT